MIFIVYGTRAELIKLSSIIKRLTDLNIPFKLIDTGQHDTKYLQGSLGLRYPDFNLGESPRKLWSSTPFPIQALLGLSWGLKTFVNLRSIFKKEKNPIIIYHGNTLSVPLTIFSAMFRKKPTILAILSAILFTKKMIIGRLIGLKLRPTVPFGNQTDATLIHIEGGFRTGTPVNLKNASNYNSLINTFYALGDHSADINIVFDTDSEKTLIQEGSKGKTIKVKDNTEENLHLALKQKPVIKSPNEDFILINIVRSLKTQKDADELNNFIESSKLPIIISIGPHIKRKLKNMNLLEKIRASPNIKEFHENDMDYVSFVHLIRRARMVITDSTGVSQECFILKTPCAITNDFIQTPYIQTGKIKVTGWDHKKLSQLLKDSEDIHENIETTSWHKTSDDIIDIIKTRETKGYTNE